MGEKPAPSQAATAPDLPLTETERLALAGMADLRPALMIPIMIQVAKSRLHLAGEIRAIFKRRLVGAQLADALAQLDTLLPQPEPAPVAAANPDKLPDCTTADLLKHVNTVINPFRPAAPKAALMRGWMDWAARYDAFDKIRWDEIFPLAAETIDQPDEQPAVVRQDGESPRIANGLNLGAQYRVWSIAHELNRERCQGRGYVYRDELRQEVQALNLSPRHFKKAGTNSYTLRHFNRLLTQGEGIFWQFDVNTNKLYLMGKKAVGRKLVELALVEKPGLVSTNLPGWFKPVYLPVGGSFEAWEAAVFAGWLAAKGDPQITYKTLAQLFGRSVKTIKRWEKNRLQGIVTKTPAFKQTSNPDEPRPAGARKYVVKVGNNFETRWAWQIANVFHSSLKQHPRKGQARKIRAAASAVIKETVGSQPLNVSVEGMQRGQRLYFDNPKLLKHVVKKHGVGRGRCLFLGISRLGNARFEPTTDGTTRTTAAEFSI